MDATTQRLDHLNVSAADACGPSHTFDRRGSFEHLNIHCQVGNPFVQSSNELVAYVNKFQPRPNHDPYSNTYNPS